MGKHKYVLEKSVFDWEIICGCIKRYWWIPILTVILSIGIGIIFLNTRADSDSVEAQYCAFATIYVGYAGENEKSAAKNSITLMNSQLLMDHLNEALLQNQMDIITEGEDVILCEQVKDAEYITLNITSMSPERAAFIAEYLVEDFLKEAKEILALENCRLVGDVFVSVSVSAPDSAGMSSFFIIIAFGVMVGLAILVLIMLFSDKIWSSFDIIQCFGDIYWGCYPAENHEWSSVLMHQCKKHAWQNLYICHGTSKPQAVQTDLAQFMPGTLQVTWLDELDYQHIPEHITALFILKKGVSSYKNINQTLIKLRGLDIEIAGCIYIL